MSETKSQGLLASRVLRVVRELRHLISFFVLLLVFFNIVSLQPDKSRLPAWTGAFRMPDSMPCCELSIDRMIEIREGEFAIQEPPEESWDSFDEIVRRTVNPTYFVSYQRLRYDDGFWFPLWAVRRHTVHVEAFKRGDMAGEAHEVRRAFVQHLDAREGSLPPELRWGDVETRTLLLSGVVWYGATLGILLLMLYTLTGIPSLVRELNAAQAARRGICGGCKYSLKGLTPVDGRLLCPECGRESPAPLLVQA